MTLKEEPRAGRPSDFGDNFLKAVLKQNQRQSTRCITEKLNTLQSTVIRHLEKLEKVSKIITGEEKLVTYENIVHKRQWPYMDEQPLPDPKANIYAAKSEKKLREKRHALVNRKNVALLHDNVRLHSANMTQEKILELEWSVLPHPSYSQEDLLPEKTVENFIQSKQATFNKERIYKLPGRWDKVIDNRGEYLGCLSAAVV
ncbi:histone-lysine N-methyltransferase SETMAR-like [Polistes fuscatus]|uniref:histone-lysine N-methyltransferase SETMAR-like n=1 Tax=Polistes fuscatus TaxID=30207 RepID=UPI001CA9A693|nr:histone-lysine N-methyltransferase SETMAR-like [Polistes fuscatus]